MQPPLGFGIQSLFFRVLGDHIFVERVYTFVTLGITALLIIVLWNQIFKKKSIQSNGLASGFTLDYDTGMFLVLL